MGFCDFEVDYVDAVFEDDGCESCGVVPAVGLGYAEGFVESGDCGSKGETLIDCDELEKDDEL